ncbi:MAG: hypothetical protein WC455_30035 [Dehalococcoidia bacterium]
MPQGSIHVSQVLSNLSVQYKNNEYIAGQVLKDVIVSKESDQYYIYGNDFRIEMTERANKAKAGIATFGYSTSSYVLKEHALKDVISDRDRANADAAIANLDADVTEYLVDAIMRRVEYEAAKLLFTITTWSNYSELSTTALSWSGETTTALPSMNVLSGTTKILKYTGKKPNALVLGQETYDALKENKNLFDRIKYAERAIVTTDLLKALFDVQNIHVGSAVYDTAAEGLTATNSFIWGSDALLCYMEQMPGLKKASAAVNMRIGWKGNPYRVKKWRDEEIEGDYIEVQTMCAPRVVASLCGYLFKSVVIK